MEEVTTVITPSGWKIGIEHCGRGDWEATLRAPDLSICIRSNRADCVAAANYILNAFAAEIDRQRAERGK